MVTFLDCDAVNDFFWFVCFEYLLFHFVGVFGCLKFSPENPAFVSVRGVGLCYSAMNAFPFGCIVIVS